MHAPPVWPVSGLASLTGLPSHACGTVAYRVGLSSGDDACLPLRGQHTLACRLKQRGHVFPV